MPKKQDKEDAIVEAIDAVELVPDPPFHGDWQLLVAVDFADESGKDVHIEPGVIAGSDLPLAFAEQLVEAGKLIKA